MDWIDISLAIEPGMPVFEGDPPVRIELAASIAAGAVCNVSRLDIGAHTGTHVDAPVHFTDGTPGVDAVPLDALIGPAWVVDASSASGRIMPDDLDRFGIPDGETRLLFRTANSALWNEPGFSPAFVALDPSAAAALAERGAVLVAADYLSVAPFGEPGPTHHALLDAGVVIVEGLDLRAVEPGPYDLICLPLRIVGCDGAPARALVRRRGGSRIR